MPHTKHAQHTHLVSTAFCSCFCTADCTAFLMEPLNNPTSRLYSQLTLPLKWILKLEKLTAALVVSSTTWPPELPMLIVRSTLPP